MANSIYRATQAGFFGVAVSGLVLESGEADGKGALHLGEQTEHGGCEAFRLVARPLVPGAPARCSSPVLILDRRDFSPSIWVPLSIFKAQHVEHDTDYPAIWNRFLEVKLGLSWMQRELGQKVATKLTKCVTVYSIVLEQIIILLYKNTFCVSKCIQASSQSVPLVCAMLQGKASGYLTMHLDRIATSTFAAILLTVVKLGTSIARFHWRMRAWAVL